MRVFLALFVVVWSGYDAAPVLAQSSPAVMAAEIDALKRQMRILQRRVNGGEIPAGADTAGANPVGQEPQSDRRVLADILAKMGTLDRQMRQLNGRLEEYEFRQNEMAETIGQLREQMALQREQMLMAPTDNAPATPAGSEAANPSQAAEQPTSTSQSDGEALPPVQTEPEVVIELPDGDAAAQYAYAFSFIRKNDLDSGRTAMEQFMAANPDNPQSANAIFWLGRINMQQSRNAEAAQLFLRLIEDHPNHEKRVDALVDLSDVLVALGASDDACNALAEFRRIEGEASDRLKTRARRVSETARCNLF